MLGLRLKCFSKPKETKEPSRKVQLSQETQDKRRVVLEANRKRGNEQLKQKQSEFREKYNLDPDQWFCIVCDCIIKTRSVYPHAKCKSHIQKQDKQNLVV